MNCDILFSYAKKCEYVGVLNFRNVVNMQVQHVFAVSGTYDAPQGMPPLITGAYTGININGVDFGSGRIVSYGNPTSMEVTENGRNLWKQTVNLEVYSSGDSGNLGSNPAMEGLFRIYTGQLASLEENFSFDIPADGGYTWTHTASVRCLDEPTGSRTSGWLIAQRIASGLLSTSLPFGFIDPVHSGFYTANGRRTYNETMDRFNGTVSFEKKYTIQNRDFVKHSVSFDNGFVNITESANIRHSGINSAGSIFNGDPSGLMTHYGTLMQGAPSRCNSLWSTYKQILGTEPYESTLNTQPTQLTRRFDERTQELNYSVTYTNNPNMTANGYTLEREQVFSLNALGVTEATEQGTITSYLSKDTSLKTALLTALTNSIAGLQARLEEYWPTATNLKLSNESKSLSIRGKRATYSQTYTNDPSFINDGVYLQKTVSTQDNGAIRMHTPYFILGRSTPLMHNPGQTQFGSATCTITATLKKPTNYNPASPVKPTVLNSMFTDAVNRTLAVTVPHVPLDTYVSRVTYSYTSDYTVELSVEAQYVYARLSNS